MRKLTLSVMTALVLLFIVPTQLKAETEAKPVSVTLISTVKTTDMSVAMARVEAIKAMDRSEMSSLEKKELRKELRAIKSDLKDSSKGDANAATINNGGVYLSVGAIIVIILLLILIL